MFKLVSNIFEFSGNAPLNFLLFECHVTKRSKVHMTVWVKASDHK